MVTKRIRSEYMKKFKDPRWETYSKCYEDLLKYRLSRRLLEQTHNPWFWEAWGSETTSSGKSSPLCRNKIEPLKIQDEKAERSTCVTPEPAANPDPATEAQTEAQKNHNVDSAPQDDIAPQPAAEDEELRERSPALIPETQTQILNTTKSKLRHTRSKVKPHASRDTDKENRHPFALYGAGERQTDMAARKTHNIHESAIRAKNRREFEKQMKSFDKQRARSADEEKDRNKFLPDFNPWVTEYMRCFSARSR
ncbi:hypothetical protein DNTS_001926 [Danionella cerebrum]|uniref:Centriole, cilia and spindle-associated protein n=1 Tax=Danionella cerebrum TaxID=2873325 RepID=A0A553Q7Y7_9TELE|nr:hypothetical protein DNTS_001926 [Danionella translucida]